MTTLRELKPSRNAFINPWAVYTEYKGNRYLFSNENDGWTAERVASQYQTRYDQASWFITSMYDSTCIDGRTKDFKQAYKR